MIDVLGAMNDLVLNFTALPQERILRAWPNRTSTPPEEYAVITLINSSRRGTNATEFEFDPLTTDDGTETELALQEAMVQFDFIGASAQSNAAKFEILSRSARFCDFLAPFEISPLYSDTPRDMTSGDGSDQYAIRWVVTLTISYWASASMPVAWFDSATVNTEVVQ